MAGKYIGPIQLRLSGDENLASRYIGPARVIVQEMMQQMGAFGTQNLIRRELQADGTHITAHAMRFVPGAPMIQVYIHSPVYEEKPTGETLVTEEFEFEDPMYICRLFYFLDTEKEQHFTLGVSDGQWLFMSVPPELDLPLVKTPLSFWTGKTKDDVLIVAGKKYYGKNGALELDATEGFGSLNPGLTRNGCCKSGDYYVSVASGPSGRVLVAFDGNGDGGQIASFDYNPGTGVENSLSFNMSGTAGVGSTGNRLFTVDLSEGSGSVSITGGPQAAEIIENSSDSFPWSYDRMRFESLFTVSPTVNSRYAHYKNDTVRYYELARRTINTRNAIGIGINPFNWICTVTSSVVEEIALFGGAVSSEVFETATQDSLGYLISGESGESVTAADITYTRNITAGSSLLLRQGIFPADIILWIKTPALGFNSSFYEHVPFASEAGCVQKAPLPDEDFSPYILGELTREIFSFGNAISAEIREAAYNSDGSAIFVVMTYDESYNYRNYFFGWYEGRLTDLTAMVSSETTFGQSYTMTLTNFAPLSGRNCY